MFMVERFHSNLTRGASNALGVFPPIRVFRVLLTHTRSIAGVRCRLNPRLSVRIESCEANGTNANGAINMS